MHVAHPHWRSYRIPLRGDFCTGRGVVAAREGAIVMIEADDGRIGQGDAGPLVEPTLLDRLGAEQRRSL